MIDSLDSHGQSLSRFKGYKIEAKIARRNIMLKLKNTRKNIKSQSSIQTPTPNLDPQKNTLQSLHTESQLLESRSLGSNLNFRTPHPQHLQSLQHHSLERNQHLNQHQHHRQYSMIAEDQYGGVMESFDRRMDQYLGVVFKKMEADTDKIINNITNNGDLHKNGHNRHSNKSVIGSDIHKIRSVQAPTLNFIKRLKFNTMKLKLKKQRQNYNPITDLKSQKQITDEAHQLLQKIRKTQQFTSASPRKKLIKSQFQSKTKNRTKSDNKAMEKSRSDMNRTHCPAILSYNTKSQSMVKNQLKIKNKQI